MRKIGNQTQNQHINYLIDASIKENNRLLVLTFENETGRKRHTGYYLPTVKIKASNVVIDDRNIFYYSGNNDVREYLMKLVME